MVQRQVRRSGVASSSTPLLTVLAVLMQAMQLVRCCADARKIHSSREDAEQESLWRDRVLSSRGWYLEQRASSMGPEAGDGVFVVGSVPVGSVVSLYAGIAYRNTHEFLQVYDPNVGSEYLMARWDGGVIDGASGTGADTPERRDIEIFAAGQIINHPNTEEEPNVYAAQFRYPEQVSTADAAYLPNRYLHETSQSWLPQLTTLRGVPGIAMVAARPLEDGEELLLNYRLNPKNSLPDWYHQHDKEEDARRWAKAF